MKHYLILAETLLCLLASATIACAQDDNTASTPTLNSTTVVENNTQTVTETTSETSNDAVVEEADGAVKSAETVAVVEETDDADTLQQPIDLLATDADLAATDAALATTEESTTPYLNLTFGLGYSSILAINVLGSIGYRCNPHFIISLDVNYSYGFPHIQETGHSLNITVASKFYFSAFFFGLGLGYGYSHVEDTAYGRYDDIHKFRPAHATTNAFVVKPMLGLDTSKSQNRFYFGSMIALPISIGTEDLVEHIYKHPQDSSGIVHEYKKDIKRSSKYTIPSFEFLLYLGVKFSVEEN